MFCPHWSALVENNHPSWAALVAQLVRASVWSAECCGFKSHLRQLIFHFFHLPQVVCLSFFHSLHLTFPCTCTIGKLWFCWAFIHRWKAIIYTHCNTSAGTCTVQYSTVYYNILYCIYIYIYLFTIILCHSQYSLITNTKCLHTFTFISIYFLQCCT